ncbi:hypothetical protein [Massilia alkalitolerans]|uniref:hypothetical protein n=1 Tax=Massilia alkalitolerans TaxID=286638 RepID=UPI000488EADD|nr:hypothetical protein [Massilia alkalitolerans]
MSVVFQTMKAVRDAFDACLHNPADAAARKDFAAMHQKNMGSFVEAFDVGGITYPRTDGHRLSETQARQTISAFLAGGGMPSQLKPGVVAIAYPLPDEVLRNEIQAVVQIAQKVEGLDWKADSIAPAEAAALRDLLRMPTTAATYAELRKAVQQGTTGGINPYRGYDADHLIPDKAMRGISTVRSASTTKAEGFATFLQDGQNKGSQHKFATDAQNAVRQHFEALKRNPTVGEYLEHVRVWMTNIYTRADLAVDSVVNNDSMRSRSAFESRHVKGFAIAQAGFMTWPERQSVGRAIATALLMEARDHYNAIGWTMNKELPLIKSAALVAPVIVQPPPQLNNT